MMANIHHHLHHHLILSWWLLLWIPVVAAKCPVEDPVIRVAGTRSMQRIAQAWKEAYYQAEEPSNATTTITTRSTSSAVAQTACPDVDIRMETDGFDVWATGAARVCDVDAIYGAVDIAGMYGGFFHPQATTPNGWQYTCQLGDETTVHRDTLLVRYMYCSACWNAFPLLSFSSLSESFSFPSVLIYIGC